MSTRRQDMLEFAIVLADEIVVNKPKVICTGSAYTVAQLADKLIRAAGRIHRLAEGVCNGDEGSDAAYERACNRVDKLLKPYGIKAIFSGDPRGASIKLVLPATKRTNGWGGEGWCVPW